jgi:hypothetical protein
MQALRDNIGLLGFDPQELAPLESLVRTRGGYFQLDGPLVSAGFEVERRALRIIELRLLVRWTSPECWTVLEKIDALAGKLGATLYNGELLPFVREQR